MLDYFLPKFVPFMRYCKIIFIAGQATDDNMEHAHCMPDTKGNTYALRMCNTYCFSPAIMVAATRLNTMLCESCLSCNPSKRTKSELYMKIQFVPRNKHTMSPLQTQPDKSVLEKNRCIF